ncbi:uncharacterized protein C2845_PM03G02870 [Panicum miliaceum]|uniref:RING-type domain-containing protein n=1 Tax=Panicum miliaceum TaxID=4540 RepID=A0A3L6T8B8_PANMI|nr:uncharacterized protein C2845_PM03G02870 [Panicum miliaceum]
MAVAMDLDAPEAELCSICLDPVAAAVPPGARSVALLQCGHKFHLASCFISSDGYVSVGFRLGFGFVRFGIQGLLAEGEGQRRAVTGLAVAVVCVQDSGGSCSPWWWWMAIGRSRWGLPTEEGGSGRAVTGLAVATVCVKDSGGVAALRSGGGWRLGGADDRVVMLHHISVGVVTRFARASWFDGGSEEGGAPSKPGEMKENCIGSAFNAKGIMQCPNCRNIEEGNWLNDANTLPPSNSDFGNGVPRETHEELIHLLQQPTVDPSTVDRAIREMMRLFSDLTQPSSIDGSIPLGSVMRSLFLDNDLEPISYHSNSEPMPFYHHTTGMMEGYPTADLSKIQVFDGTEPRISVIEQPYLGTLPLLDFVSRPTAPFGFEYTPQSGSSSVAPLGPSPAVTFGGHGHGLGGHVVQQTVPPATPGSPYPPTG